MLHFASPNAYRGRFECGWRVLVVCLRAVAGLRQAEFKQVQQKYRLESCMPSAPDVVVGDFVCALQQQMRETLLLPVTACDSIVRLPSTRYLLLKHDACAAAPKILLSRRNCDVRKVRIFSEHFGKPVWRAHFTSGDVGCRHVIFEFLHHHTKCKSQFA